MARRFPGGRWAVGALLALILIAAGVWQSGRRFYLAAAEGASTSPSDANVSDTLDLGDDLDAGKLQERFAGIAKRVAPAVVSISCASDATNSDAAVRSEELNPQKLQDILDKTARTVGTGFIVNADGYILTNEHVVEDSAQYWVTTDGGRVYPAIVVGADPRADLAVLKIPAHNLPTVHFSKTCSCERGQWSITLGNPVGLASDGNMAISVGVISATGRSLPRLSAHENRLYSDLIQTSAQINLGNSGGPLLDLDGNVIGIDTAVILPQKETNGIGFAIPITPGLLAEVEELRQGQEIVYGYLGVTISDLTDRQRHELGLGPDMGIRIESIEAQTPAADATGLRVGDVVAQINGQTVADSDHFIRMVGAASIERPSAFEIFRNGAIKRIEITPIKRPVPLAVSDQNQRLHWRGMELGPIPANWLGSETISSGGGKVIGILVVGIDDDSPLKKQGVEPGTVITSIAGKTVTSMTELQKVLNDVEPERCEVQILGGTAQVVSAVQR